MFPAKKQARGLFKMASEWFRNFLGDWFIYMFQSSILGKGFILSIICVQYLSIYIPVDLVILSHSWGGKLAFSILPGVGDWHLPGGCLAWDSNRKNLILNHAWTETLFVVAISVVIMDTKSQTKTSQNIVLLKWFYCSLLHNLHSYCMILQFLVEFGTIMFFFS